MQQKVHVIPSAKAVAVMWYLRPQGQYDSKLLVPLVLGCNWWFISLLIHRLVYKTSENSEKCPPEFPRVHSDVLKCLVLSDQQSWTQRSSVYSDIKQVKAANPHFGVGGTTQCLLEFLLTFSIYYRIEIMSGFWWLRHILDINIQCCTVVRMIDLTS